MDTAIKTLKTTLDKRSNERARLRGLLALQRRFPKSPLVKGSIFSTLFEKHLRGATEEHLVAREPEKVVDLFHRLKRHEEGGRRLEAAGYHSHAGDLYAKGEYYAKAASAYNTAGMEDYSARMLVKAKTQAERNRRGHE